ncbi:uncharacterized protein Z519_00146 [Cladophialophora bantiana CBS 173.52]|uniref:Carboxylic ester hydrolase n=1 Tax=Cladophialophora bantiana (strain ATCC 10958 / CBS 173.52 / CDC B-1940 / NIH 8579) TaxID=1442370 RepID=A0A0D2I5F4_CLAB1|nr:uncharacterized protein Z519_00146 [Cladophialophora bantiana CBS 173.52]KIW98485.1 hypothetical protein Z519_00146 [Cladophialophora bantiana CBS 173.52]
MNNVGVSIKSENETTRSISEDFHRPLVTLPQGRLKGIVQTDGLPQPVECFLGCAYAQPPVGDLRFRPPVPVEPSSAIFDASEYGRAAPGNPLIPPRIPLVYGEDCLTVNVFRPRLESSKGHLLPVAVYIHGGAFNRGNSSMHNTTSMVAWSEEPFIAVSFNYRVGALGFLPSQKSAEEGILNLGFQDQRLLLRWVQENIQAFGGDKNNVTLIGLSAGAISIGHLILHYSDENPGPFHRAIIESGSATTRDCRPYNSKIIEQYFTDFLAHAGCPQDLTARDTFAYLRKLPLSAITSAQDAVFDKYKPTMQWAFRPVIDGDIIRQPPLESWHRGQYYKIPIMTGFCTNEGSLYVDRKLSHPEQFTRLMQTLLPGLPGEDIARLNDLYPDPLTGDPTYQDERTGKDIGAEYMRAEAAYGQYALIAPVRQTAHLASSMADAPPVYLYHWDVFTTLYGGAAHADNLGYETFDRATTSLSRGQEEVAGMLHAYMTSFICHGGDPNKLRGRYKHRPTWEPYTPDRPLTMILGKGNRELIGGDVGTPAELTLETCYDEQCKFWWERTQITQQ